MLSIMVEKTVCSCLNNILIDQEAERQVGEWGWVHPQAPNPISPTS